MFALVFRFPSGRFHATPWGRHVNEGAVAWPPEPYRILRALIATWHRKADKTRWDETGLQRLIEALASSVPAYRLPDAVHAHTRHYMPQGEIRDGRERTSLVFDAFYRIDPSDQLVVAWKDVSLGADELALADHLAALMNYLGRAESIVIARATDAIEGPFPVVAGMPDQAGWISADILVPLSPVEWAQARPGFIAHSQSKPRSRQRVEFEETVPLKLTDALQVETSQLQRAGWSRPPAGYLVTFARPEVGPRPSAGKLRRVLDDQPTRFQVARFVLAGRPLPPITEAVKIGEILRRALMAHVKGPIPATLSGRNENGEPLRDPQHAHAFFLAEDADEDGFIDHLVLYARPGLDRATRRATESLQRLWIKDGRVRDKDDDDDDDPGRREWRLALEGFGTPGHFSDSALLRASMTWVSLTPYLRPHHLKGGDPFEATRRMIQAECLRRGWAAPEVERTDYSASAGSSIRVNGQLRNVLAFHRFRSRRDLTQPDRTGISVRLAFPDPIKGPIALGFACHFGLGLFRAE
jgi:CRISPR-associated protein Csb2